MQSLIENFGNQLEEALQIGEKAKLAKRNKSFANVLIVGMGGSGIAGTIISELVAHESKIPILVSKHYFLPAFVSGASLVIVSSYSGNTEESIEAILYALKKKAKVVCIASGGKILEIAKKKKLDYIVIPAGMPPRACLGYSLMQMFFILNRFGIITGKFKKDFKLAISLIRNEKQNIKIEARKIAKVLLEKIPIIYSSAGHEGVSVRFRQQLNENSKMLAWHNIIPEMNHNELVGWTKKDKNLAVVIFRNDSDYSRVKKRIDVTKEIISKYAPKIVEIHSKGKSMIEKAVYHIHLTDWVSAILAEMKEIDSRENKVIDYLKNILARGDGEI